MAPSPAALASVVVLAACGPGTTLPPDTHRDPMGTTYRVLAHRSLVEVEITDATACRGFGVRSVQLGARGATALLDGLPGWSWLEVTRRDGSVVVYRFFLPEFDGDACPDDSSVICIDLGVGTSVVYPGAGVANLSSSSPRLYYRVNPSGDLVWTATEARVQTPLLLYEDGRQQRLRFRVSETEPSTPAFVPECGRRRDCPAGTCQHGQCGPARPVECRLAT